jgi:MFS family permease
MGKAPVGIGMNHSRTLNRILLATILGSSMVFLDSSVANIILPRLQESFHRSLLDMQWVITAYGVTLAALLLLGGALGDRYGRRRIFLTGLSLFSLASAACAVSPGFWALITARSVQGVGGALLTPESLAILNATFPRDQRARAIGTWSAASALAGVIAPPLGGWIAEVGSWRAVFLVNLPIAMAAGYLGWTSIPVRSFRGIMGQGWKKDPLMEVPTNASQEFRKSIDAARLSSYRDLLWAGAAMSALAGLTVVSVRKGSLIGKPRSSRDSPESKKRRQPWNQAS